MKIGYSSIVAGMVTFILALINFKNFPKGLKRDKTLRMYIIYNKYIQTKLNMLVNNIY